MEGAFLFPKDWRWIDVWFYGMEIKSEWSCVSIKIYTSGHIQGYSVTTDIDDYTDNDGILHRNILPAKATKIEFSIKPVRLKDLSVIKSILPEARVEVNIEYWNDWSMKYQSGKAYIPDLTFEPYIDYPDTNDCSEHPYAHSLY